METTAYASTNGVPKEKVEYGYDYRSRRISKKSYTNWNGSIYTTTSERRFVYDGWNVIAEFTVPSGLVCDRSYVWGLDVSLSLRGAGGVGGLVSMTEAAGGTSHFYAFDGNGNVVGLMSATTGDETARYEYGPFGELVRSTGLMADLNPYRFSTKYQDDESEFLYYGFRYYELSSGRWLSRDPIEELGGGNLFGFVNNHPTSSFDILGLAEDVICIMCHGVSAFGYNGDPRSFSGYLPGSGPGAAYGYRKLATVYQPIISATGMAAGGAMMLAPEPTATKVIGFGLLADSADKLTSWFTDSPTYFESTLTETMGLTQDEAGRVVMFKDISLLTLTTASQIKYLNRPLFCQKKITYDPKLTSEALAEFKRLGVEVLSDDEAAAVLAIVNKGRKKPVEAMFHGPKGEPGFVALPPKADRMTVLEELKHAQNHQARGYRTITALENCQEEIKVARELIKDAKANGYSIEEELIARLALRDYLKQELQMLKKKTD